MDYQTIKVEKNTPAIGATISNVDLSAPLSNKQFDEIHDALLRHSVIFF
ncbi:MAG TPA: taurine dioxygenase, partial [Alphaproteobacteria bacterium]|nr:taurine dioxygenase [Alphaproteobacteria bacterium]HBF98056.1 taurine dioxygenase [Alphaproteobacteria bacterium]